MASNSTEESAASPPAPSEKSAPPPPPPQKDSAPPPKQSPPPPPPPKEDASPPPASSPPPPSPPPPSAKETAPPPAKTEKPQNPPPQESTPAPKTPAPPTPTPPASRDSPPAPAASESKVLPPPPPPQPLPSTPTKNVPTPSLGPPAPSSPNTGDSPSKGGVGTSDTILIVGVTGAFVVFIVAALLCVICMRKKEKKHYYGDPPRGQPKGNNYGGYNQNYGPPPPGYKGGPPGGGWGPAPPQTPSSGGMSSNFSDPTNPASPNLAFGFNQSTFTYDELAAATDKFSHANLLGQGGFGYVHKGVLPSGKVVAVKSLKSGSGQGEREFHAEVDIISRVHHRHLVSLVGYCIAGGQRMLVYEFVPNGNLEQHLHANYKGVTLDWSKRVTIGIGSAKGLAYLHEDCHPRIIHRDIKAANILIDNNYEAMVADFGLAKLTTDNLTHVSTRVMGTFGYMAPEYASSGKLTEKSDVYSFGVMLLELITGRRPVDTSNSDMDDSLVDWARPIMTRALGDGNFDELVDPSLENNYNANEMKRMIACASASIRHSAKRRPKMSQIVRALEGDVSLDDLNNDVTRANQSNSSSTLSSVYDTRAYNEDLKKFQKLALESQIEGDEYGVNPTSSSEEASSREMK